MKIRTLFTWAAALLLTGFISNKADAAQQSASDYGYLSINDVLHYESPWINNLKASVRNAAAASAKNDVNQVIADAAVMAVTRTGARTSANGWHGDTNRFTVTSGDVSLDATIIHDPEYYSTAPMNSRPGYYYNVAYTITYPEPVPDVDGVYATISASPTSGTAPLNTTVTWSSQNAASVKLIEPNGNTTTVAASGSKNFTLTSTGTNQFRIEASAPVLNFERNPDIVPPVGVTETEWRGTVVVSGSTQTYTSTADVVVGAAAVGSNPAVEFKYNSPYDSGTVVGSEVTINIKPGDRVDFSTKGLNVGTSLGAYPEWLLVGNRMVVAGPSSYSVTSGNLGTSAMINPYNDPIPPLTRSATVRFNSPGTYTVIGGVAALTRKINPSGSPLYMYGVGSGTFTDKAVKVIVSDPTFNLTVNSGANGSASGSASGLSAGDTAPISATADSGYAFDKWVLSSGNAVIANITSANTTVTMGNQNSTVLATFKNATQAPVSSNGGTITIGQSFTPVVMGGSGSGAYEVSWGNQTSFGAISAFTPSAVGDEIFYARRLGDATFNTSAIAGPYTLKVVKAAQPAVASAGATITIGQSFTPAVTGGSGTGAYEISWGNQTSFAAISAFTPSAVGDQIFYARRLGDANFLNSSIAGPYTLKVIEATQAAVSSNGGTITIGQSFTPVVTGGSGTGAYEISWGDQTSFGAISAFTPSAVGDEIFYARRLGDGTFTTSAIAGPYTLKVIKDIQPAVASSDATIKIGETFNPVITGGAGTGAYQIQYVSDGLWRNPAPFTPPFAGTYSFNVKRLGDATYEESAVAGVYKLTVEKLAQSDVLSQNETRYVGDTFQATISGGDGTGAYMIKFASTLWQPGTSNFMCAPEGIYKFQVKRAGDSQYLESALSPEYTLTVIKRTQGNVTSSGGKILLGDSFLPVVNGGNGTGTYQVSWDNGSTWGGVAPFTPTSAGSYSFLAKRLGDNQYLESSLSPVYTLEVVEPQPSLIKAKTSVTPEYNQWFIDSGEQDQDFERVP